MRFRPSTITGCFLPIRDFSRTASKDTERGFILRVNEQIFSQNLHTAFEMARIFCQAVPPTPTTPTSMLFHPVYCIADICQFFAVKERMDGD